MPSKLSSSASGFSGVHATELAVRQPLAENTSAAANELNILQQRRAGGEDNLNLHAIWTCVSRYAPARPSQQSYREKLAEAYITASFTANRAAKNVNTSLWTDMDKNLSALLKPVVLANGSELEIPHSMIARSRLQVHPQRDIEDMIGAVEDPDLRKMLTRIYHHPLAENVGARSDLLRHLCGMLDKGKVNVYMDIDELTRALTSQILLMKQYQHLSLEDIVELPPQGRAQLLIFTIGDELISHTLRNRTLTVPPNVLVQGHLTYGYENNLQGQVPDHPLGKLIARQMLISMNHGESAVEPVPAHLRCDADGYRRGIETAVQMIAGLTRLSALAPSELSSREVYSDSLLQFRPMSGAGNAQINRYFIDHFLFAESVRQSQDEIQHDIDILVGRVKQGGLPFTEKYDVLDQIAGRHMIFSHCMRLVEGAVNMSTLLPQISSNAGDKFAGEVSAFNRLFEQLAGNLPYRDSHVTGSWKGKLMIDLGSPLNLNRLDNVSIDEAFSAVRNIVLKRLGGGYQVS